MTSATSWRVAPTFKAAWMCARTSCSRFSTVSEATAQSSRCFWEMTSRLYGVPVKNMESSRARSLSNFFHVSKPVPPLRVWKSIWAVFRVFSFRASSIMGLLLGLRRPGLPVREGPRDDLTDLGHREGLGQPRAGRLGKEGGHGGAQRIAGGEDQPAPPLRPPPPGLTVETGTVQDGNQEIAQDEIVLVPLDQGQCRRPVRRRVRLMPLPREDLDEETHDVDLVVHHWDAASLPGSRGHLDASHGQRLGWIRTRHGTTPRGCSNGPRGRYHTRACTCRTIRARPAPRPGRAPRDGRASDCGRSPCRPG